VAPNESRPVVLTPVQARRVLAYLTVLERSVIEGDIGTDALPIWEQLEEVILGLDGLALTIDAVVEALGEDDGGGGEEGGVREPRDPPPDGGQERRALDPDDEAAQPPQVLPRNELTPQPDAHARLSLGSASREDPLDGRTGPGAGPRLGAGDAVAGRPERAR
jgi:hypothetical protein